MTLIHVLATTSIILSVPGPTNTLLFSAGLKLGARNALPLVIAEALGYTVAITFWGFALLSISQTRPWVLIITNLTCAFYIAILAIRLWSQGHHATGLSGRIVNTRELFFATTSNPKAFLFAGTVFPAETFQSPQNFLLTIICFLTVLLPIGTAWTCLGSAVNGSWRMTAHISTMLRSASIVLAMFSLSLLYSVWKTYHG